MGKLWTEMRRSFRVKKTYIRMFVSFALLGTILITAVSSLLYVFFSQKMVHDVGNHSNVLLKRDADNVSFLLNWTMSYAFRSSRDVTLEPYVQHDSEDMYVDYGVWTRLREIRDNHPFIDSIVLYNGYTGSYLDTTVGVSKKEKYYDQDLVAFLDGKKVTISHLLLPRIVVTDDKGTQIRHRWLTVVIPYDYGLSPSMFILNINMDSFSSYMTSKLADDLDEVYLIDQNGIIVAGTELERFMRNWSDLPGGRTAIPINNDWVIREVQGSKKMFIYSDVGFSSIYKWKLVEKLPVKPLLGGIQSFRNLTLFVLAAALVIIVLAYWRLSKKIYSPIENLIDKVKSSIKNVREPIMADREDMQLLSTVFLNQDHLIRELSEYRRNTREMTKNAFLRKLLVNTPAFSELQLEEQLKQYGIRLNSRDFIVGVCRIDGYLDFAEKYSASDRSLLRFGMANIIREHLLSSGAEAFDMGEDHVGFILNAEWSNEQLHDQLQEAQRSIRRFLDLSATVSVGKPVEEFKGLNRAYKEALSLTERRFTHGLGRIFLSQETDVGSSLAYIYPEELERPLLISVRQSNEGEAVEALEEFFEHVRRYPHSEAKLAVIHLILNLDKALGEGSQSALDEMDGGLSSIEEQLIQLETMESIFEWLSESIVLHCVSRRERMEPDGKQREVVHAICGKIDATFMDPNLSTKTLSDYTGLSANYIRTLFKATMGISIMDYISDKRLEHACELLRSSSLSVEEIAEVTGFTAISSFYSGFKKRYHITPNKFRKT